MSDKPAEVLATGKINPEWLDTQNGHYLEFWTSEVLHGRERNVPREGDWPVFGIIRQAYNDASAMAKRGIRDAIYQHLQDMADNKATDWIGDAAHQLLLAAVEVCDARFEAEQQDKRMVSIVEQMVRSGRFKPVKSGEPPNLHVRLLQALSGMGFDGSLDFWIDQMNTAPEEYVAIAFRALARQDLHGAIELLSGCDINWTPRLVASIWRALSVIQATRGQGTIERAGRRFWASLPSEVQRLLEDHFGLTPETGDVSVTDLSDVLTVLNIRESFGGVVENLDAAAKLIVDSGEELRNVQGLYDKVLTAPQTPFRTPGGHAIREEDIVEKLEMLVYGKLITENVAKAIVLYLGIENDSLHVLRTGGRLLDGGRATQYQRVSNSE